MQLKKMVFHLEDDPEVDGEASTDGFFVHKTDYQMKVYADFWKLRTAFQPKCVFEMGIWSGGSVVFWHEYFRPDKHVAIDLLPGTDSRPFTEYVGSTHVRDRLKTYWGVDQGDAATMNAILEREFDTPLDLVIDDASHLYAPTKKAFETLFPRLRPGGLYLIEDWTWGYKKEHQSPTHPFAGTKPLAELIHECVDVLGSTPSIITDVSVNVAFAAIERGGIDRSQLTAFQLVEHITK